MNKRDNEIWKQLYYLLEEIIKIKKEIIEIKENN